MIALYRGFSPISCLIRFRTWSKYSHAAELFPDQSLLEAWQLKGVHRLGHWSDGHTPGTQIDLFDVDMTEAQHDTVREFLLDQLGKGYDYRGVLGFISRRAGAHSQKRWFCSELQFAAYRAAGVELLARTEPWQVSPGLLSRSPLLRYVRSVVVPMHLTGEPAVPEGATA